MHWVTSPIFSTQEVDSRLGMYPAAKGYTRYLDLLADPGVDMVDIIVPHVLHYEIAKAALEHGKHVLVEKPITVKSEQGEELIALAKQKGLKFSVAENTHFVAAYLKAELRDILSRAITCTWPSRRAAGWPRSWSKRAINELTGPETWAVAVADFSQWYVDTSDLSELDVVKVSVGQTVSVTADALPGVTMSGVVEAISAAPKTQSGDVLYTVHIRMDKVDPLLRWGMTVEVTFNEK